MDSEYDTLLFSSDNLLEEDGDDDDRTTNSCDVILLDTSNSENESSGAEDAWREDLVEEQSDGELDSDTEMEHGKGKGRKRSGESVDTPSDSRKLQGSAVYHAHCLSGVMGEEVQFY